MTPPLPNKTTSVESTEDQRVKKIGGTDDGGKSAGGDKTGGGKNDNKTSGGKGNGRKRMSDKRGSGKSGSGKNKNKTSGTQRNKLSIVAPPGAGRSGLTPRERVAFLNDEPNRQWHRNLLLQFYKLVQRQMGTDEKLADDPFNNPTTHLLDRLTEVIREEQEQYERDNGA